jgi:hypothetical protein
MHAVGVYGARACPPEDCEGVPGYQSLVSAMKNPKSDEAKDLIRWLGGPYDAAAFDVKRVKFSIPARRLQMMLDG